MPAIEHSFLDDDALEGLYLDTDFLINCVFASEPYHQRCRSFFVHLFELGRTQIYLSSLTWLEYLHVVTRESFRQSLPGTFIDEFQLAGWARAAVRETYVRAMLNALERVLAEFDWFEVSLTPEVRRVATRHLINYRLGGQDAIHLASAEFANVSDVASFDRGFRRVDGLNLWNDRVYAGESLS